MAIDPKKRTPKKSPPKPTGGTNAKKPKQGGAVGSKKGTGNANATPVKNRQANGNSSQGRRDGFQETGELARDKGQSGSTKRTDSILSALNEPASPEPSKDKFFDYDQKEIKDYTEAQAWGPGSHLMSGVEANKEITAGYHHLNTQMQDYLAGDPNGTKLPQVSDWSTFAKYASGGEVQKETRLLENVERGFAGEAGGFARAAVEGSDPMTLEQGARLGTELGTDSVKKQGVNNVLNPLGAASGALADTAGEGVTTAGELRDALVKGNTEIWRDVAPGYDAFLKGESDGGKGMEKLKEAGYYKGSEKDPHGLITQGFSDYKAARELGLKAQGMDPKSAEYKEALAERQRLMERGNLRLVAQEQLMLESDQIYNNPRVKRAISTVSPSMGMKDANGGYRLLPNGGDWTKFEDRMGVKQVPKAGENTIDFPDKNGKMQHFAADPSQKGTISHYFKENSTGPAAESLIRNQPSAVDPKPKSHTGNAVIDAADAFDRGDAGQFAGQTSSIPARVASDVTQIASDKLDSSAQGFYGQGYNRIQQGRQTGGITGAAQQIYGGAEMLEGGLRETASDYAQGASNLASATGDVVENVVDAGVTEAEETIKSYKRGIHLPTNPNARWIGGIKNPFSKGGMLDGWGTRW